MLFSEVRPGNNFVFLKFMDEEYIDTLRKGDLYLRNAKTFIDMEKVSERKGMGDKYDTSLVMRNAQTSVIITDEFGNETGDTLEAIAGEITFHFDTRVLHPIYCLYVLDGDMMELCYEDDEQMVFKPKINPDDLARMKSEFADTLVLIDAGKFIERIKNYCEENKEYAKHAAVKYCDFDIIQDSRITAFFEEFGANGAFYKDKYFEYQKEYRFLFLSKEIEDPITLSIGDISDFTEVFNVNEFFESYKWIIQK